MGTAFTFTNVAHTNQGGLQMKNHRRILAPIVSVALFAGILVVPLSGSASAGTQTSLTIANSEWLYTCGFSPFNPIDQFLAWAPCTNP